MKISASVQNSYKQHQIWLKTDQVAHSIEIPHKSTGFGSSANGGELLFLALATCYCNDIYREAAEMGIEVTAVEVEVEGEFGAKGEPAREVTYRAKVAAQASEAQILDLMMHTDRVAEIQNTLRSMTSVVLTSMDVLK